MYRNNLDTGLTWEQLGKEPPESLGARKDWQKYLDQLIHGRLVISRSRLVWTPVADLVARGFAKRAHGARGDAGKKGDPYQAIIWDETVKWFELNTAKETSYKVSRQENLPDRFSPFDLCENCYWLDKRRPGAGQELLDDCVGSIRSLVRGEETPGPPARKSVPAGEVVRAIGRALRAGAKAADAHWGSLWHCLGDNRQPVTQTNVQALRKEIEAAMKDVVSRELRRRKPAIAWVSKDGAMPNESDDLVFLVEGLGGQRNLESKLPFYSLSLAAARLVRAEPLELVPVCSGVYVPGVSHLYLGVSGENCGAALIDERLFEVHELNGVGVRPGGSLTVGVHHSRQQTAKSRLFLAAISKILPPRADKELALGAGNWSLALTAAGSLAAYFEASVSAFSAYAGALILCAAVRDPMAATDLGGKRSWLSGNPLKMEGILAWGDRTLRDEIEAKVVRISKSLPQGEQRARPAGRGTRRSAAAAPGRNNQARPAGTRSPTPSSASQAATYRTASDLRTGSEKHSSSGKSEG